MADTYSYSRLETFDQCAQKFKFQYLDRVAGDRESIEAFMGSRVHETLEKLYKDLMVTKLNTLEDLLASYDTAWTKNWHDKVVVVKAEYHAEHYRELGRRCLRDYYKRFHPFQDGKTLGLEDKFLITIAHGEASYRFTGVIDRLVWKGEGEYEIHDYKTGSTPPTQEAFDKNKQLAIYQMSLKHRWPDVKRVKLIWHYLALDKDFVSVREEEDLSSLNRELVERIQTIEAATAFPPRESALCRWCEFRSRCPLWRHEVEVSALPATEYAKEDGVQLVKRYVELTKKVDTAKQELEALERAIFEYAAAKGLSALDGPDHRIRIFNDEEVGAPLKKDDPLRWEQLRQLMLKSGKYPDVSTINGRMLAYQLERGNWPADLKKSLEPLLRRSLRKQIKLYQKSF